MCSTINFLKNLCLQDLDSICISCFLTPFLTYDLIPAHGETNRFWIHIQWTTIWWRIWIDIQQNKWGKCKLCRRGSNTRPLSNQALISCWTTNFHKSLELQYLNSIWILCSLTGENQNLKIVIRKSQMLEEWVGNWRSTALVRLKFWL